MSIALAKASVVEKIYQTNSKVTEIESTLLPTNIVPMFHRVSLFLWLNSLNCNVTKEQSAEMSHEERCILSLEKSFRNNPYA